jgi:hypothetical protein
LPPSGWPCRGQSSGPREECVRHVPTVRCAVEPSLCHGKGLSERRIWSACSSTYGGDAPGNRREDRVVRAARPADRRSPVGPCRPGGCGVAPVSRALRISARSSLRPLTTILTTIAKRSAQFAVVRGSSALALTCGDVRRRTVKEPSPTTGGQGVADSNPVSRPEKPQDRGSFRRDPERASWLLAMM